MFKNELVLMCARPTVPVKPHVDGSVVVVLEAAAAGAAVVRDRSLNKHHVHDRFNYGCGLNEHAHATFS